MGDTRVLIGICCYGDGAHTDRCPLRDLPTEISPELARALLVELAAAFDEPHQTARRGRWSAAVDRAIEAGRRMAPKEGA